MATWGATESNKISSASCKAFPASFAFVMLASTTLTTACNYLYVLSRLVRNSNVHFFSIKKIPWINCSITTMSRRIATARCGEMD